MTRRDFIKDSAVAAAGLAIGNAAAAGKRAPDYMPILNERMKKGDYLPYYSERELTKPALLCDERGRLNPEARGWSRVPLLAANLSGHFGRKKKWNFWNFISPEFVISTTIANIDYANFCSVDFTNFATRETASAMSIRPGSRLEMPEEVEQSVAFRSKSVNMVMNHEGHRIKVEINCPKAKGGSILADFVIHKPADHETLNIVVPWSDERFQMNSKHNTLPVEGSFTIGGKRFVMNPENCHGVQDFGRGMWPYHTYWNWGVLSGKQGRDVIGVNMGAKWTTGTGANENGICFNGRLYKVMEDLQWDYDPGNWSKPWKIKTNHTDMLDLTLNPIYERTSMLSLGVMSTGGTCAFGNWSGVIKFDGKKVDIDGIIGWAEEFAHRW